MSRRRSTPWIQRWSRPLIGSIAVLGAIVTGYLTVSHQLGQEVACPTSGCDAVLSSAYASVFGLPLSLFGFLAYAAMAVFALGPLLINPSRQKALRNQLENWSWLLLLVGATAMVVFSGYLIYLLAFKIQAVCIYCVASAIFTIAMFFLTVLGRDWPDLGQLWFTAAIVGMIALISTLGVYATATSSGSGSGSGTNPDDPFVITTTSGPAELALADYLKTINAKMYGAYWCPHCHDQKNLFGKEAFAKINYIECDPNGANAQPDLCQAAKVPSYPTWDIKGKMYAGTQPLTELASYAGYTGPQNFKNTPGTP